MGRSRLEDLQSIECKFVISTLFHREIGHRHPYRHFPNGKLSSFMYDKLILRQLMLSRNVSSKQDTVLTNKKTNRKSCTKTDSGILSQYPITLITRNNKSLNIGNEFFNVHYKLNATRLATKDFIIIYGSVFVRLDNAYTCFSLENGILKERYKIPATESWQFWEIWTPPDHPITKSKRKITQLLFTLSGNGRILSSYDFYDGTPFHEQVRLNAVTKYSRIESYEEKGQLVLHCVKISLPQDLHYDCIIFNILDFKRTIHIQIKKCGTNDKSHPMFEVSQDVLMRISNDSIQIWDLTAVLSSGTFCEQNANEDMNNVIHVISELPEPLLIVRKCKPQLSASIVGYPPHYVTNKSVYDMSTMASIPNQSDLLYLIDAEPDHSLEFHPDGSNRLIFSTKDAICIASLLRKDHEGFLQPTHLQQEFRHKFMENGVVTVPPNLSSNRFSFRPRKVMNYTEFCNDGGEVLVQYEYSEAFEALVIMEVSSNPLTVKFNFYDNQSWKTIGTIILNDELLQDKLKVLDLNLLDFSITDTEIILRQKKSGNSEITVVYLIPLLIEEGTYRMLDLQF